MKKFRRIIAFALFVCLFISLLPPVQITRAAQVVQRYELDTDGIDAGATYLIVSSGSAGTANALRFYYGNNNNNRKFLTQTLTVKTDANGVRYIDKGFTEESNCQFQFSGATSGKITHGNRYVDLANGRYSSSSNVQTLTFASQGSGAYRIYYTTSSWFGSGTTNYLRFNNSTWERSTTSYSVYLYKLVEYEVSCNVYFDGNGYTSGKLPANRENLDSGSRFTIPYPEQELRKDIGQDTWLFLCWNTEPDGSGTEYVPGTEITVTDDMTLYACWYQQTKHVVTMATELNGVRTDVTEISGLNKTFAAGKDGIDGQLFPMERTDAGTYIAKVAENGDYVIYTRVDDGAYEPAHGHMVTIFNQDGTTVCQHFTVSYDTQGGDWAAGQDPGSTMCHALETVTVTENIPTREGYRFLGWRDQNGNFYAAGTQIHSIQNQIILSAVWEHTIDVTIRVVVNHATADGYNNAPDRHDLLLQVLRQEGDVNLPLQAIQLDLNYDPDAFDLFTNTTTYTVVLKDQPQGIYHVLGVKSDYNSTMSYTGAADEDQTITLNLKYAPDNFDLAFRVKVNADTQGEEELMPQAVNVKVNYWGLDKSGNLGWYVITQQDGDNAPTTIAIDENGEGVGYFPVWNYWSGTQRAYEYRLVVTSFVMPDGSIVAASGDLETYVSVGSGLYTAEVSVVDGGRRPTYPAGSSFATNLSGSYFDGNGQAGTPVVTVEINPFTVTLDADGGTVNGNPSITLTEQYKYPDLSAYIADSGKADSVFLGWVDENGNLADTLTGTYLTKDVVLTAKYGKNITLSGTVHVHTTYEQDGHTVNIHEVDLPQEVMILVRKQIGEQYITLKSQKVEITYTDGQQFGTGLYEFSDLPNDGTQYQISVLAVNYDALYDHDLDGNFAADEDLVIVDSMNATATADALLEFNPEQYRVGLQVDATQIAEGFRPSSVLAKIMYRDLGDIHAFNVISQHTVPPYGVEITQDRLGQGYGSDEVWARHVDGTYYEYQMELSRLYGSVEGAYVPEGTDFTENSPFTVEYGAPSNEMNQDAEGNGALKITLVPKEYKVILDLNLDKDDVVRGMDDYMVDDGTGNATYAYVHTWSYASSFEAYPYRDGYVFEGWQETAETTQNKELIVEDGTIYVGATLAKNVTLTAKWRELKGTDYTIRHLELNTNKVLHGAQTVSGTVAGTKVVAADAVLSIPGYNYAGAMVDGTFVHKANNPEMIVSNDPLENLLIIYYLPDSSSGYTEQVENNLSAQKTAVLEDNGTYTITLDTYAKNNPITTRIRNDIPLDVVLVLDQSGSMQANQALGDLKSAVENFITLLADHGRTNEVDHRLAIVGYASNEDDGYTNYRYPTAGSDSGYYWYNTGVFGVHGDFHPYSVTGFNYVEYNGQVTADGVYYTNAHDEFLLLTYHEEYRHLITEEEARYAVLENTTVYGYVDGQFVELTRNSSGLWLYGDKKLYTSDEYFTYHTNVWTHREGLERREIHAYGLGDAYHEVGEHKGVYTRVATKDANPQKSIYEEALNPISLGANGSGGIIPGLQAATQKLGANGMTRVSYGMEMANKIFEANPLEEDSDRLRIVIVFTDGKPGDGSNFFLDEANKALEYASIASDQYGAEIYSIGLYGNDVVAAESDQVFFMNGLSSNYPDATKMDDIWVSTTYKPAESGVRMDLAGPYFVNVGGSYYELTRSSLYENKTYYNLWGYTDRSGNRVIISKTPTADGHPVITDSKLGDYTVYRQYGVGFEEAANTGYYVEATSSTDLKEYFAKIMRDITTNETTEIVLESGTIIRDIMNQGLMMTDDTVITVWSQAGSYNAATKAIDWSSERKEMVKLALSSGSITATGEDNPVTINVYNMDAANPTDPADPNGVGYHPHTVDVTGYDFTDSYISDGHSGYKILVTITGVEARDDVQWGRSTATNHERSGLWLPATAEANRQLLLAFNQPTTIFVERAYVLDYGKEFTLSDWYFDNEYAEDGTVTQKATPIHLDFNISDGMNRFDPGDPNEANAVGGQYGNTKYGNVKLADEKVTYSPTTMNWGGYDQFYVFGETWRKTVLAQDANENGNLWNKVTVIPANNIYYEDSFITKSAEDQGNGIEGFQFTGEWKVVTDENQANVGQNTETPEHLESAPYGDVHGWTDSLGDDKNFTDGSAHAAGLPDMANRMGATASFTFTGTGVDVYTRTNCDSGLVIAILYKHVKNNDGSVSKVFDQAITMDNLAVSGDYFHIPTISFNVPYGTYSVDLVATMASENVTGVARYEYYLDGIRVYNPLGNTTAYQADTVKAAYGLETNAVFTEVRDILLDYGDFNPNLPDGTDGKMGAVFIDWLRDGQGSGSDKPGVGVPTYEIGTFETYGPKNEVYLTPGQAVVLKVAEGNTYYVGMKSLTGDKVKANVSGIDLLKAPTTIEISHSTDMYYRVNPVDGYIVIQNGETEGTQILSITNLRTTNPKEPAKNGGVLAVQSEMAVMMMRSFSARLMEQQNVITPADPLPEDPAEEIITPPDEQAEATIQTAQSLFLTVRRWLEND